MPAQGVVGWVIHDAGRDRVEVDVDDELLEIGRVFDEFRLVPALPHRTCGAVCAVVLLAESGLDIAQGAGKGDRPAPQRKVVVVEHQAKSKDGQTVSLPDVPEQLEEPISFAAFFEDLSAPREAVVDVINPAFNKNPRSPWHQDERPTIILSKNAKMSALAPSGTELAQIGTDLPGTLAFTRATEPWEVPYPVLPEERSDPYCSEFRNAIKSAIFRLDRVGHSRPAFCISSIILGPCDHTADAI